MGEVAASIAAIGGVITAIGVILTAYWAYRAKQVAKDNEAKIIEVGGQVFQLGQRVDGRLSELLEASRMAARAEGIAQGEQSQRDRTAPAESMPVTVTNDPDKPIPTKIVSDDK